MTRMMTRTVLAAGLLSGVALGASPPDQRRTNRVNGTHLAGSRYRGTAEIVVTTKNTCRITWDTGSTAEGICMRNSDAFAAAYSMGDAVGLVIYEVHADGSLEGLWTVADQEGVGTETLTPR